MEQQVGERQLLQGGLKSLHQMVGQLADKAYRVAEEHGAGVGNLQGAGSGVQGIEKPVVGGNFRAGELIEQGGFTRVGVAYDGHHRHLVLLPALALGGTDPAHVPQLLLQLGDFPADMPPVSLQLGLTRTAGTDGTLLAFQMAPHADQPGQQIFVLGQFHLKTALPGTGTLGKDIQNQGGAVQYAHLQLLPQHPLLGGRQGVVKDDHVRTHGAHQLAHLVHLALADEGAGIWAVLLLEHHAHTLASGGLQQVLELLHGLLGGVLFPGEAVGAQAHQHRPVQLVFGKVFGHTTSKILTWSGPPRSHQYTWCGSPSGDTSAPSRRRG